MREDVRRGTQGAGANSCNGIQLVILLISFVRGVLQPPLTKEIPSFGADAIRPERWETIASFE